MWLLLRLRSAPNRRNPLSKNQETVDAITAHTAEYGVPPTMRELGERLGLSSTSSVFERVKDAQEAGLIEQVGPRKFLVVSE